MLYSLPLLYHHAFSWDISEEIAFYDRFLNKCPFPVKKILEPACGSGRYFKALEEAGYHVTGYDKSAEMISFAEKYLYDLGLRSRVFRAGMEDFLINETFDAALNPVNSFRYLLKDDDVLAHLNKTAAMLRPGAIYILEFCYAFADPDSTYDRHWSLSTSIGNINARWHVLKEDHEKKVSMEKSEIMSAGKQYNDTHLTRLWTYEDFLNILEKSDPFSLEAIYDQDQMQVLSPSYFGEMGNLYHILKRN